MLIVGAGLIGLKCLEGIADRVGKVTVVDMAPHILPSILDDYGASIIQKQLEKHGAEFYLSDSVASFEKGVAHLKSGATVPFDILVVAAGVRPNVELVKEAGGKVGRGILTDDRQETSLKDVYAAGDCTESYDITCGQSRISGAPSQRAVPGLVRGHEHGGRRGALHQRRSHERHRIFRFARPHGGFLFRGYV